METYTIIASWLGWPVVCAILILSSTYILSIQKQNINVLQDSIENLNLKIHDLEDYKPDIVLDRVLQRHKVLSEEIEELKAEGDKSQFLIAEKEHEQKKLISEIIELKNISNRLDEKLKEFICPICGSDLVSREYHICWEEVDGKDIDFDVDVTTFECGCEVVNGSIYHSCQVNDPLLPGHIS